VNQRAKAKEFAMSLLISLLPATILAALGYIILYCSSKEDGAIKAFGQALAAVLFVFAATPILAGAYFTFSGISPGELMEQHMSSYQK
jgi:hypothetical protein